MYHNAGEIRRKVPVLLTATESCENHKIFERGTEMIWYFLAGMVAGAVGIMWLARWLSDKGYIRRDDKDDKRT